MKQKLKELQNKLGQIANRVREINNKMGQDKNYIDEGHQNVLKLQAEAEEIEKQIEAINVQIKFEAQEADYIDERSQSTGKSADEVLNDVAETYNAYDDLFRNGFLNISEKSRELIQKVTAENAMDASEQQKGGHFLQKLLVNDLIKKIVLMGSVRAYSHVFNTDHGNIISLPTLDDGENEGRLLSASSDDDDAKSDTMQSGEITIGAYEMTSRTVKVGNALIQDTGFNLVDEVLGLLADRIRRLENRLFTVGTGVNEPRGLLTAAEAANPTPLSNVISFDDIIELEHALDAGVRLSGECSWAMNDKTLKIIKKLKDNEGNYIWKGSTASGEPATILGYPYHINQNMDDVEAGKSPIVFGKLNDYHIRDVNGVSMKRFDNDRLLAEENKTGFLLIKRADGNLRSLKTVVKMMMKPA